MVQESFFNIVKVKPKDIVMTPEPIAKEIVNIFNPSGFCLDPCKGDGVFFKLLPDGSDWCEIREGRDFFQYDKHVDWIVSNPPYSIFTKFMRHSFEIADNIVYLIPTEKPFLSYTFMKQTAEYGGIKHIHVIGPGNHIGFPTGFAVGAVHFQRGFHGGTTWSFRTYNNRMNPTTNSGRENWLFN